MVRKDATYWVSRFGIFEGADHCERAEQVLTRMGARAVPALVAALRDAERGWEAAMVLGQIGLPGAARAIPALEKAVRARGSSATQMWAARALGQLGELDRLMRFARSKPLLPAVVAGLKMARPASYVHYETLLARNDKGLAREIAKELAPGSASYDPPADGFDAVAAAARSAHVSLRKDAALALAEFRGKKAKQRSVEVLVPLLADRDGEVRRLAALALGWCKSAARSAIPALRPLLRDRVALVRGTAKDALEEIGES